ncbi:NADH:flavin oxidoreductase/NADH oxidase [Terriglobus roseus]|uniref:2,4-dienoyl-CoA reductase n=1 Tax=Terriglobus roseus TaxID=392734 RepID=A0A1H4J0C7_9BACT|nr:NADH:flavin oxidoreductase/NADH oxidase [Terriglobus roseus]SEB39703.1 2,4-dienoyl-CoA reductase [Terriglobus roseus]
MSHPSHLFAPFAMRSVVLPNRIALSPMCQYSAVDGMVNDWHLVHLGSRAVGGAGLILTEATAVSPEGRLSPGDLGLWSDDHISGLERCVNFIHQQGAAAGIQLGHAGRKSSIAPPWEQTRVVPAAEGGWEEILAPSAFAFSERHAVPRSLSVSEIGRIQDDFRTATERAYRSGFDVIELHAAHGYLFHQFLSPLSNTRGDEYGGTFDNRVRMLLETVRLIRAVWPEHLPLIVRISATDWLEYDGHAHPEGLGWMMQDSLRLVPLLRDAGVDLVDVSSGGNVAQPAIPVGAGYQTAFSAQIREQTGVATGTVGMITSPQQADHAIRTGQADLVLLARELLRNPYWPIEAARQLKVEVPWPVQYVRAADGRKPARLPWALGPR